jgi:hypothetical protein
MTYDELVKEIKKRFRKAEFDYQEASGDGDDKHTMWCKSRMEALESLVMYIEDAEAKQKYSKVLKKGRK